MSQIGVIVPVYQVEPYLRRCVDSILNQTFRDFVLVLVDDGSPDNCGEICDSYAIQDSRTHVIHQKNAGLSAARNAGIDWAFANTDITWLTFIDSDDWVHPEMLERLMNAALEKEVLVSICGLGETGGEQPVIPPESLTTVYLNPNRFYQENNVNATVACGKLYHRRCFETIRYPVGKIHEDEYVTYRTLYMAPVVAYTPAPLYAYFVNYDGITRKAWSPKRMDAWDAYEEQLVFFEQRGDREMWCRRFREYLENTCAQLRSAQGAPERGKWKKEIRFIKGRMRSLIRRGRKMGCIAFWTDYDMLYACAPLRTKLYRFWLELRN